MSILLSHQLFVFILVNKLFYLILSSGASPFDFVELSSECRRHRGVVREPNEMKTRPRWCQAEPSLTAVTDYIFGCFVLILSNLTWQIWASGYSFVHNWYEMLTTRGIKAIEWYKKGTSVHKVGVWIGKITFFIVEAVTNHPIVTTNITLKRNTRFHTPMWSPSLLQN